jgi:hypothetical protein
VRRPIAPPKRESNTRAVVLTAVIGVLVLGGAAFAVTSLLGGDDKPTPGTGGTPPVATEPPADPTATPEPIRKNNALVLVFNGTSTPKLAARYSEALAGDGYPQANLGTATLGEAQQTQTSVVMYGRRAKAAAQGVADTLGIETVVALDDATQTAVSSLQGDQKKDWNVVAIIGQDKI